MKFAFRSTRLFVLAAMAVALSAVASPGEQQPAGPGPVWTLAPATVGDFATGDVVSVIGDSITWSRQWHRYIHEYYVTRFPGRRVSFINAGISGDGAGGVLKRLERDVLTAQPNAAVFLLGMNDVGRGLYAGGTETNAADLAAREEALAGFRTNMTTLSHRLRERGVRRLIYCTPTPYDETAVTRNTNKLWGVNAGLSRCGEVLRDVARGFGGEVIDFNGPMTVLNRQGQQTNAAWSIVGWDRIHPQIEGQMVMAYLFLKAQGVPALVSSIALDAAGPTVVEAANARVSELAAEEGQLAFTVLDGALPWPIEAAARPALGRVPLMEDLNRQMLRVVGLKPGEYRLSIDDAAVGEFSAAVLAQGVNLAACEQTPQYRQALEVQALLERRRADEMRLRVLASKEHWLLRDLGVDLDDFAAVRARLQQEIAALAEATEPKAVERRDKFKTYIEDKPRAGEFRAERERMLDRAYAAAQPRPHRYTLRRVPSN